jgi:hypothetical protein
MMIGWRGSLVRPEEWRWVWGRVARVLPPTRPSRRSRSASHPKALPGVTCDGHHRSPPARWNARTQPHATLPSSVASRAFTCGYGRIAPRVHCNRRRVRSELSTRSARSTWATELENTPCDGPYTARAGGGRRRQPQATIGDAERAYVPDRSRRRRQQSYPQGCSVNMKEIRVYQNDYGHFMRWSDVDWSEFVHRVGSYPQRYPPVRAVIHRGKR